MMGSEANYGMGKSPTQARGAEDIADPSATTDT